MDNTQYGSKVRLGVMVDGEYVELGDCAVVNIEVNDRVVDVRGLAQGTAVAPFPFPHEVTFSAPHGKAADFLLGLVAQLKRKRLRYRMANFRELYGRGVGAMTEPQICGRVLQAKLIHNLNYIGRSYRLKSKGTDDPQ
jgi:hypothetical protein